MKGGHESQRGKDNTPQYPAPDNREKCSLDCVKRFWIVDMLEVAAGGEECEPKRAARSSSTARCSVELYHVTQHQIVFFRRGDPALNHCCRIVASASHTQRSQRLSHWHQNWHSVSSQSVFPVPSCPSVVIRLSTSKQHPAQVTRSVLRSQGSSMSTAMIKCKPVPSPF